MDCDDHSRCYLIGIIEAVIHKPGDKWSFAHCGGREKQWNYTVNASQNLVCSLHRQHMFGVHVESTMSCCQEGDTLVCKSLNSDSCCIYNKLPIKFRISYKILLLAYKALNDLAPAYLTNLLSRYNPTRSLRSQNSGLLVVPRIAKSTKGGRTFSYLAPKLWNSLPENVRGSDTLSLFKSRLKTHLFSQAFI